VLERVDEGSGSKEQRRLYRGCSATRTSQRNAVLALVLRSLLNHSIVPSSVFNNFLSVLPNEMLVDIQLNVRFGELLHGLIK
jgi:hypothetical protein